MRSRTDLIFMFALIVILLGLAGGVTAQGGPPVSANTQTTLGTAFTYQGKITNNGGVVNGNCNMAFRTHLLKVSMAASPMGAMATSCPLPTATAYISARSCG